MGGFGANLPLHNGRVPPCLAERMASLGAVITQAIVHHYGRDEFLKRLSHPFWFHSFDLVRGMDGHLSDNMTIVIGSGLAPLQDELGIHVYGARDKHLRRTPDELTSLGGRTGFDADTLTRASRLVTIVWPCRMDSNFICSLSLSLMTGNGSSFSKA